MTQDEFASKLGVTRVAISKWELGKSYPSIENLKTICSTFNVSFDDLLEDDKKQDIPTEKEQLHSSEAKKMPLRKKLDIGAFSTIGVLLVASIVLTSVGLAKTFGKKAAEPNVSPIESIYVSEKPTRMTYLVGQSFSSDGMVVNAVREDSTEEEIQDWTVDVPSTFENEANNGTYNVSWIDYSAEKEYVTTLDGVNVYKSLKGVFF